MTYRARNTVTLLLSLFIAQLANLAYSLARRSARNFPLSDYEEHPPENYCKIGNQITWPGNRQAAAQQRLAKNLMDFIVDYFAAGSDWRVRVNKKWGEKAARHLHFEDGFTIIATYEKKLVGMISVYWRTLPKPITESREGYIDIIEIDREYRRRGIASRLIHLAIERATEFGAYQIRAWSSEDKLEAIPMWQALGFGLAPATVFQGNEEIRGFYAVKVLKRPA